MIGRTPAGRAPRGQVGPMWQLWTVLVVGITGAVMSGICARSGPIGLVLAGITMVLLSTIGGFAVVLRDARANGTGWWRAADRAFREAFSWFWNLLW